MKLGAVGAVFEGYHRDTREIVQLGFPVFSLGAYAQDQSGPRACHRLPLRRHLRQRRPRRPGDIIVGDIDGVVVIPKDAAADIVRDALAKVEGEDDVRRMIEGGEPTGRSSRRPGSCNGKLPSRPRTLILPASRPSKDAVQSPSAARTAGMMASTLIPIAALLLSSAFLLMAGGLHGLLLPIQGTSTASPPSSSA